MPLTGPRGLFGKIAAALAGVALMVAFAGASKAADYPPLREAQELWVKNYQTQNADGMAELYAKDAWFAGMILPQWFVGRDRIHKAWSDYFGMFPAAQVEVSTFKDSEIQLTPVGQEGKSDSVWVESGCLIMDMKKKANEPGRRAATRYSRTWLCSGGACQIVRMHDSLPGDGATMKEPLDSRSNCITE